MNANHGDLGPVLREALMRSSNGDIILFPPVGNERLSFRGGTPCDHVSAFPRSGTALTPVRRLRSSIARCGN